MFTFRVISSTRLYRICHCSLRQSHLTSSSISSTTLFVVCPPACNTLSPWSFQVFFLYVIQISFLMSSHFLTIIPRMQQFVFHLTVTLCQIIVLFSSWYLNDLKWSYLHVCFLFSSLYSKLDKERELVRFAHYWCVSKPKNNVWHILSTQSIFVEWRRQWVMVNGLEKLIRVLRI